MGAYDTVDGPLSLLSLQGKKTKYRHAWLELRWDVFTCVVWQVTLCDPIWQAMPRSSEMEFD